MFRGKQSSSKRKGAAVTEFAIVAPLLVLITFGAIDAGQGINVTQIVNDASREGARQATRRDVTDVDQVEQAVKEFITDSFGGDSDQVLSSAVKVSVSDSIGAIPGGDLSSVSSGSSVTVEVALPYDSVRWISFLPVLNGITMRTTTVMRRE